MSKLSDSNDVKDWLKHILDEVKTLREDQKAIMEEQKSNTKVLTQNTVSLEEHIRRTALLEDVVKEMREDRKQSTSDYDARIRPLEKQSVFITAYWKLALFMITILTSEAFVTAWHLLSQMLNQPK